MYEKIFSIILIAVTTLGLLAFAACGKHEHAFDTTWQRDETDNWHVCTGDGCDEISDKAAHVYDHACDVICNVCGATRTIAFEKMVLYYGDSAYISENVVSGKKNEQHVFKVSYSTYEIFLSISDKDSSSTSDWRVVDFDIRVFDENFNELNVRFEADNPDNVNEKMAYVYILDADGKDISEQYNGKTVYFMVTTKVDGENYKLIVQ